VRHRTGGLAMVTVLAALVFSAISGSAPATTAAIGSILIPAMAREGYDKAFAASIAVSAGVLGPLIPPSIAFVIWGTIAEQSIGKLFLAGIVPGLAIACGLLVICYVHARRHRVPRQPKADWPEVGRAFARGKWALLSPVIVLGGIYGGVFTATEGAGIGASGAFFFALARRTLTWRVLLEVLVDSARTTAMLFTVLIAAMMFANFVNFTTMPNDLRETIVRLGLPPLAIVGAMMLIYVVLGTLMEELSMVLLTLPVFFPIVTQLGFDPVWFGVLIVLVVQIGLISPPVGMNLFVLNALLPQVSTPTLFRGVMPFFVADVIRLGILIAFPAISLWLPSMMR
jgi:C4-dicarboxylate transporter DctM subunit